MLSQRLEREDRGPAMQCIGMLIERNQENRTLFVSHTAYLKNVFKRFGMTNCKPVSTPVELRTAYKKLSGGEKVFNKRDYQAAIGSLKNYAMIASRPIYVLL